MAELSLRCGGLAVSVLAHGATVVAVEVPDRAGTPANVVLRDPDPADHRAPADRIYLGSTMGRFARIVPYGRVVIDGREHRLTVNAGPHQIHGGPEGFDARNWSGGVVGGRIELALTSPDGDQGHPGTLRCTAMVELDDGGLTVRFAARTDRSTLCGLTTHVFWNLAGAGAGPVDGHVLQLGSAQLLEADAEFVPTGRLVAAPPELDFTVPRPVGDTAIDRFFAAGPGVVARLTDPGSGRTLAVETDQTGLAVYTGDQLPRPRAGICLQPGPWPYVPDGPGPDPILRPGRHYRSRTRFFFGPA